MRATKHALPDSNLLPVPNAPGANRGTSTDDGKRSTVVLIDTPAASSPGFGRRSGKAPANMVKLASTHANEVVRHGFFQLGRTIPTPGESDTAGSVVVLPTPTSELWVLNEKASLLCLKGLFIGPDGGNLSLEASPSHLISSNTMLPFPLTGAKHRFSRVLYLDRYHMNVGWAMGSHILTLLTADMNFVSIVEAPSPIYSATYNLEAHALMTGGRGEILEWAIHQRRKLEIKQRLLTPAIAQKLGLGEAAPVVTLTNDDCYSKQQHVFASMGANIIVLTIVGEIIKVILKAHSQHITSVLYCDRTSMLITAAHDGTIAVWDVLWQLRHLFVGHTKRVTSLLRHPYGGLIISSSLDGTLCVWNINNLEPVLRIQFDCPIQEIGMLCHKLRFYSLSNNGVTLWQINHVLSDFTRIGETLTQSLRVESVNQPARLLVLADNGGVCVISPVSGQVLTTIPSASDTESSSFSLPWSQIINIAYSSVLDMIYCLTLDGVIIIFDAGKHPAEFVHRWDFPSENNSLLPTVLCVVEGSVHEETTRRKSAFMGETSVNVDFTKMPGAVNDDYAVLVAIGTYGGHLQTRNGKTGDIVFSSDRIHTDRVLSVVSNNNKDTVVSVGADMLVNVLKIESLATATFSPSSSFVVPLEPVFAAIIATRLCVVVKENSSGRYPVLVYDTETRASFTHLREHDHVGTVTAATACSSLGWFSTCSIDGLVKIWSENNTLLRKFDLGDSITTCIFYNRLGNLAIGVKKNLSVIPCEDFLPTGYMATHKQIKASHVCADELEGEVVVASKPRHDSINTHPHPASNSTVSSRKQRRSSDFNHDLLTVQAEEETLSLSQSQSTAWTPPQPSHTLTFEELMKRRQDARYVDPLKKIRPNRHAMRVFLSSLYPSSHKMRGLKTEYGVVPTPRERGQLTPAKQKELGAQAKGLPDAQAGASEQLYFQWLAGFKGKPTHGRNPPVAPDGYIPNSLIWQQMREFATKDVINPYSLPTFTAEQLEMLESESDEEDSGLMDLAKYTEVVLEEEEEEEDEEVEQNRTRQGQQYKPKPKPDKRKPPPLRIKPPTPEPDSEESESEVESPAPVLREPTPEPIRHPTPDIEPALRPELPSYITMFLRNQWFKKKFPKAPAPATFDFLRKKGTALEPFPQVTMTNWLKYLVSIKPEKQKKGSEVPTTQSKTVATTAQPIVDETQTTHKRKGLLWKFEDAPSQAELVQGVHDIVRDVMLQETLTTDDKQLVGDAISELLQGTKAEETQIAGLPVLGVLRRTDRTSVSLMLAGTLNESTAVANAATTTLRNVGLRDNSKVALERLRANFSRQNAPSTQRHRVSIDYGTDLSNEAMEAYRLDSLNKNGAQSKNGAMRTETREGLRSRGSQSRPTPKDVCKDSDNYITAVNHWAQQQLQRSQTLLTPPPQQTPTPPPTPPPLPQRNVAPTEKFMLPNITVGDKRLPRIGYLQLNRTLPHDPTLQRASTIPLGKDQYEIDHSTTTPNTWRGRGAPRRGNAPRCRSGQLDDDDDDANDAGGVKSIAMRRRALLLRPSAKNVAPYAEDNIEETVNANDDVPFSVFNKGRYFRMPDGVVAEDLSLARTNTSLPLPQLSWVGHGNGTR